MSEQPDAEADELMRLLDEALAALRQGDARMAVAALAEAEAAAARLARKPEGEA